MIANGVNLLFFSTLMEPIASDVSPSHPQGESSLKVEKKRRFTSLVISFCSQEENILQSLTFANTTSGSASDSGVSCIIIKLQNDDNFQLISSFPHFFVSHFFVSRSYFYKYPAL